MRERCLLDLGFLRGDATIGKRCTYRQLEKEIRS